MSTAVRSVAVVGNSVAAMFSALTLGEAGWKVILVTPSPQLGGHFAGLTLAGHTFDAGMVFLEFTSFNSQPDADISTYDPTRRNDVGRFFPLVERTLGRFGEWRNVSTPHMRVDGQLLPDLLIANNVNSLADLAPATRAQMREELEGIMALDSDTLHPSRKVTDCVFARHDLETVSLANHGRTFHRMFIEPFCRKLLARPTASLLALYHRLAWLPLFYPETLASALANVSPPLPQTVFAFPTSGALAHLVKEVERQLRSVPSVDIVRGRITALTHTAGDGPFALTITSGQTMKVDHVVWASDSEQLLALCGESAQPSLERASLVVASILARAGEIETAHSTLLVPADERLPFRITNQSVASGVSEPMHRLSCEWSAAVLDGSPDSLAERARDALVEVNVLRRREGVVEMRVDVFKDALSLPTPANAALAHERRNKLDELLPTVRRVGPAAPFGAASLNDQIVQGLKVGRELGEGTWR